MQLAFSQMAQLRARSGDSIMSLILRRHFLKIAGVLVAIPSASRIVFAQAPAGPKLTQILKKDIEGQGHAVQETVVSIVEFGPGISAPWHMHPSAQETLYALEGNLIVEVDRRRSPRGGIEVRDRLRERPVMSAGIFGAVLPHPVEQV